MGKNGVAISTVEAGTRVVVSKIKVVRKESIKGKELRKVFVVEPEPQGWIQTTNHKGDPNMEQIETEPEVDLYGGTTMEQLTADYPLTTRATSLSISSTNSFHSRQSPYNLQNLSRTFSSLQKMDRLERGQN